MSDEQREYRTVILGALLQSLAEHLKIAELKRVLHRVADPDLLGLLASSSREPFQGGNVADERAHAIVRLVRDANRLAAAEQADATREPGFEAVSPIFPRVQLLRSDAGSELRLPVAELGGVRAEPPIMPVVDDGPDSDELATHARAFQESLTQLGSRLNEDDFESLYTHLMALLHRFGTCLAGDTQNDPADVSMYDRVRVTSALAACLYQYHAADGILTEDGLENPPAGRCILLVGDVSGIQDYLFDIATVGAGGVAKRLRSRSFFLQMFPEVASQKILREFDLPLANTLMSSGGKFYILLPNLEDAPERITALQAECNSWLLQEFHGQLALNLAWTEVADEELDSDAGTAGFSAALSRLHEQLAHRKRRRLADTLCRSQGWDEDKFIREPFPAEAASCVVCSHFPAAHKSDKDGDVDVCAKCYNDVKLGERIPTIQYIGFYNCVLSKGTRCFDWTLVADAKPEQLPPDPVLVTRLNNTDLTPLAGRPATFRFLTTHVPREPDNRTLWTFEDIAARRKLPEGQPPQAMLAVIKADVDYLGQVFSDGLRRDTPPGFDSPSRIAALSRQLDNFFSAWLQWLLEAEFPRVYAVYAGGDDLLLVAPRGEALLLVKRIREAFARYTNNPELTLSAGIAVVKPRLPLAHTVEFADKALERAKRSDGNGTGRNRLCLLNHVLNWSELPLVENSIRLLERNEPPTAVLYQLLHCAELWRRWNETRNPIFLRFQPMLAYSISRNLKPKSDLFTWASRFIGFPVDDYQCEEAQAMNYLGLVVQWVLLGRRETQNVEN